MFFTLLLVLQLASVLIRCIYHSQNNIDFLFIRAIIYIFRKVEHAINQNTWLIFGYII